MNVPVAHTRVAHTLVLLLTFTTTCSVNACSVNASDNWPQWRGPFGNGTSDSTDLPVSWNLDKNIVWKTELPSWSSATPVIWGDRVFVTSPTKVESTENADEDGQARPERAQQTVRGQRQERQGERLERGRGRSNRFGGRRFGGRFGGRGRGGRDPGGSTLMVVCLSRDDGSIMWKSELDEGNWLMRKQNACSPSPVTDGKHVWVVTGNGVLTALDMAGNEIWKVNIQDKYGRFGLGWGYASSPLLHDGKLIVQVLHGRRTDDPSYVVAFDAESGDELWFHERDTDARNESPDAYTTPALLEHNGQTQIVILGGDYVTGHDPQTGAEIWRGGGINPRNAGNYRIIASPVAVDGMIFAPTRQRPLLAFRAGGQGDISASQLAWKWDDDGGTDVPTPACDGEHFYLVSERGLITCIEAKTGKVVWGPNRTGLPAVSASPLVADGKVYVTSETGVTNVFSAGPQFNMLASNQLDGTSTLSSMAAAGHHLFLRTSTHVYCIGNQ